MPKRCHRVVFEGVVGLLAVSAWGTAGTARGADLQLDDDTTLTADVLRLEDDAVLLRLPRGRVKAINGVPILPALVEGAPAPAFSVTDLSGTPRAVGGSSAQTTVLHFWVQWCPHCRADVPQLQALSDQFKERPDVQLLTVNLDQDRTKVEQFIAEQQLAYPVIFAKEHADAPNGVDLVARYEISGFPVTFIVDRQGVIRRKILGSFAEMKLDLAALLTSLL